MSVPPEAKMTMKIAEVSAFDDAMHIGVRIPFALVSYAETKMVEEIVRITAERFVEENYDTIIENLNPVAIANLAIAQAAGSVIGSFMPKQEARRV